MVGPRIIIKGMLNGEVNITRIIQGLIKNQQFTIWHRVMLMFLGRNSLLIWKVNQMAGQRIIILKTPLGDLATIRISPVLTNNQQFMI